MILALIMKALIDTNIWLDFILQREQFSEDARVALMVCINEDIEIYTASNTLTDIFYIAKKTIGTKNAYNSLVKIFEIAEIAAVDSLICRAALNLERPDYEDGIIAAVAQIEKVDYIITRDLKAFKNIDISCYSPKEFVTHLGYEEIDF